MIFNQGTTFVFYIPIGNTPTIKNSITSNNPTTHIHPKGKTTALLVDDYAINWDLHRLLLEKEGIQVIMSSDGKETL